MNGAQRKPGARKNEHLINHYMSRRALLKETQYLLNHCTFKRVFLQENKPKLNAQGKPTLK